MNPDLEKQVLKIANTLKDFYTGELIHHAETGYPALENVSRDSFQHALQSLLNQGLLLQGEYRAPSAGVSLQVRKRKRKRAILDSEPDQTPTPTKRRRLSRSPVQVSDSPLQAM